MTDNAMARYGNGQRIGATGIRYRLPCGSVLAVR
ncbi:hypothetical protein C7453_101518 [Gluconacetobacter liquefaciens]|uniref:Uncharacterized protein n=1 Tax=Gluconacetobacter liquefaciens TaxID=89584 RepID=A0A370GCA9_GLULI|nr:hypothetical protein C7453_101518 [Gluconacetobacter liquefaciens]